MLPEAGICCNGETHPGDGRSGSARLRRADWRRPHWHRMTDRRAQHLTLGVPVQARRIFWRAAPPITWAAAGRCRNVLRRPGQRVRIRPGSCWAERTAPAATAAGLGHWVSRRLRLASATGWGAGRPSGCANLRPNAAGSGAGRAASRLRRET